MKPKALFVEPNVRFPLYFIVTTYQNKQKTLRICKFAVVGSHDSLFVESVLNKN